MGTAEALRAILARFPAQRVLVLGDVILDRYWWGEASRLSPEAPVPVVRKRRATSRPGGAGNTAANLAALGASVTLFGVTGEDPQSAELKAVLAEAGVDSSGLVSDPARPTSTKTRVIATHQQIVRVDDEEAAPVSEQVAAAAAGMMTPLIARADAVVVSDYAKGFLAPGLLERVIELANHSAKPVFIDPKGTDYRRYLGCSMLKPNRMELGILAGMPAGNRAETAVAGQHLSAIMPGTKIIVTEGAEGMTLFAGGVQLEHVGVTPRQVFDVTGAGDTVLAALAMAITAGATERQAMLLATEAAGIAIGMMGTAAVTLRQIEAAIS